MRTDATEICPCCGTARVPKGELCGPCCQREADALLRALEDPRFAKAFDQVLLAQAIDCLGGL